MPLAKIAVAQQVRDEIRAANQQLETFRQQDEAVLRHRPTPDRWSVLDCLEHINLMYADYLPRMQAAVAQAAPSRLETYSPGFWGQKMVKDQRPVQGQRKKKMKTFKKLVPVTDHQPSDQIFDRLFRYHEQLEQLLGQSERLDWNRVKVNSALGPLLRLKLGDCFRVLMAHTERHLLQGQEVMEQKIS